MTLRVETVTMPAFLASALINGDTSGMNADDQEWLTRALEFVAPGYVVSCDEDSHFANFCDLPGFYEGADMIEYTVHYRD